MGTRKQSMGKVNVYDCSSTMKFLVPYVSLVKGEEERGLGIFFCWIWCSVSTCALFFVPLFRIKYRPCAHSALGIG